MAEKKVLFVFGTRPELIKILPLMVAARRDPTIKPILCSTGQHREMLEGLYDFFSLRPDIDFALMQPGQTLASLHAAIMSRMEKVLEEHRPDWVVVQGDTTSAQAAAMAAFFARIPVAHVEAGLRTYDLQSPFPEEMNRRTITLLSRLHLCPTDEAAKNLLTEQLDSSARVAVTGNTGIDTLLLAAERIRGDVALRARLQNTFPFVSDEPFILMTMHRRENFGPAQKQILRMCLELVRSHAVNILFPVHPNPSVRGAVEEILVPELGNSVFREGLVPTRENSGGKIFLTAPLEYPALVYAMERCSFVMTDSGGLQEEAPSFGKKILVLRESTERPEGVAAGFSNLVGTDCTRILREAAGLLAQPEHWPEGHVPANPYGDGRATERILRLLRDPADQSFLTASASGFGRAGDHDSPTFR